MRWRARLLDDDGEHDKYVGRAFTQRDAVIDQVRKTSSTFIANAFIILRLPVQMLNL